MGVVALQFHLGELVFKAAFLGVGAGGDFAGHGAAVHGAVFLGEGDRIDLAGFGDIGAGGEVGRGGGAQRIGVEPAVDADQANKAGVGRTAAEFVLLVEALAVAERDHQRVFRLAEGDEDGDFQRLAVDFHPDHRRAAVFAFAIRRDLGVFA